MIVAHLGGGLGNQLFVYAAARCLAYKNNTDFKLEIFSCEKNKNNHHGYYALGYFNIQENFATLDEVKTLKRVDTIDEIQSIESVNGNVDNVIVYSPKGSLFGEKYFEDIEDILRQELTPKNPFGRKSNLWKEKILSAECAVSLHIRHGDYLAPHFRKVWAYVLPNDYYLMCIEKLKKIYNNLTVFVFSDDLKWCKENFKLDIPTEFVEGCESEVDELFLMSYCKHNIVANSTFSWWGAWLNQNPDKKVFIPLQFMLTAKKFIAVPVNLNAPPHIAMPLLVSVILHVENDINTVEFALRSILSQQINDYELIILDSSNDGSDKICHRFSGYRNVTVVKEGRSVGKFAAWNRGIECARGYYVMFMTCKDFIFPKTLNTMIDFSSWYQDIAVKQKGIYQTYENYGSFYPNVVCSNQVLEENPSGELTVDGFSNKNFSIRVDAPFKELKNNGEFKFTTRDKVLLLSMLTNNKQTYSVRGNKFFKRTFLNENNIRFNEKNKFDTQDTELQFLTEVFIKTEEIYFIPQLFYGHFN